MSRKIALVIGNSEYQDAKLARLVTPTEDVNDLAEVLRAPDIGGFDLVTTLIDETDANVRLSIEDFFAEKSPDDLLVMYFSGHGIRDEQGKLYLAVNNTRANRLFATAIPAEFITSMMDRSRSKRQVLILDCCHSGAFAPGSKSLAGESVGTGPAFEGTGYGRVVLTATDATQYAWEGDQVVGHAENSVFTHYLIEGLKSGAADSDRDGRITVDEMYDYVYEQIVTRSPRQTPGKWSYKQQGDIVIAKTAQDAPPAESPMMPSARSQLAARPTVFRHTVPRWAWLAGSALALGLIIVFVITQAGQQPAGPGAPTASDANPPAPHAGALTSSTSTSVLGTAAHAPAPDVNAPAQRTGTLTSSAGAPDFGAATQTPASAAPTVPAATESAVPPTVSEAAAPRVALYRYVNRKNGNYHYTLVQKAETDWSFDWLQGYLLSLQVADTVPLYSYHNDETGQDFYTTDAHELDAFNAGYRYVGILGYVYDHQVPGTVPFRRYVNRITGQHFYTPYGDEDTFKVPNWSDYQFERIQCYIFREPQ